MIVPSAFHFPFPILLTSVFFITKRKSGTKFLKTPLSFQTLPLVLVFYSSVVYSSLRFFFFFFLNKNKSTRQRSIREVVFLLSYITISILYSFSIYFKVNIYY
ncbi:hypothetical protein HMI55_003162 [Coelomomyces lativittatus]|nr:hypothetical protein HMI55_003162 [Coelomomyces lativittatus]